jgi:DNA repair exonuclease SbcCD ATPase subunit
MATTAIQRFTLEEQPGEPLSIESTPGRAEPTSYNAASSPSLLSPGRQQHLEAVIERMAQDLDKVSNRFALSQARAEILEKHNKLLEKRRNELEKALARRDGTILSCETRDAGNAEEIEALKLEHFQVLNQLREEQTKYAILQLTIKQDTLKDRIKTLKQQSGPDDKGGVLGSASGLFWGFVFGGPVGAIAAAAVGGAAGAKALDRTKENKPEIQRLRAQLDAVRFRIKELRV